MYKYLELNNNCYNKLCKCVHKIIIYKKSTNRKSRKNESPKK